MQMYQMKSWWGRPKRAMLGSAGVCVCVGVWGVGGRRKMRNLVRAGGVLVVLVVVVVVVGAGGGGGGGGFILLIG
jgi:hypothetical protein